MQRFRKIYIFWELYAELYVNYFQIIYRDNGELRNRWFYSDIINKYWLDTHFLRKEGKSRTENFVLRMVLSWMQSNWKEEIVLLFKLVKHLLSLSSKLLHLHLFPHQLIAGLPINSSGVALKFKIIIHFVKKAEEMEKSPPVPSKIDYLWWDLRQRVVIHHCHTLPPGLYCGLNMKISVFASP